MKLLDQYQLLHKKGLFRGGSLYKHRPEIEKLLKETDCKTLLDYGSGKGQLHQEQPFNVKFTLYDPAVKGINVLPSGKFDAVICTDVLEHIPAEELDESLENIFSRAEKLVYLSISTKPANKILPNGLNAHVTVKPKTWWLEKLANYHAPKVSIHFD